MIAILLILLLSSCSKSEVIEMPLTKGVDTTYTPRVADSTEVRQPIRFDVTVGDWKEITIE